MFPRPSTSNVSSTVKRDSTGLPDDRHTMGVVSDYIVPTTYSGLDFNNTGVPTITTPTNTTTTFAQFVPGPYDDSENQYITAPLNHEHQAGFVPPPVQPHSTHIVEIKTEPAASDTFVTGRGWQGGQITVTQASRPSSVGSSLSGSDVATKPRVPQAKRMGGRKPRKTDNDMSPEDAEKVRVRRERNKQAAARCRKRRVDHTNKLLIETSEQEETKKKIEEEIRILRAQKEELQFILEAHKAMCNLPSEKMKQIRIKQEVTDDDEPPRKVIMQEQHHVHKSSNKPVRPSSLAVSSSFGTDTRREIAGIPIQTPSAGMAMNYDSLMNGGTGLTPVSGTGLTPLITGGLTPLLAAAGEVPVSSPGLCNPKLAAL